MGSGGTLGRPPQAAGEVGALAAGQDLGRERALLVRARQGDDAAFAELVSPLLRGAFHLAVRLLGDRDLAEDVTQEALVKAWVGVRRFRGDARFSTWVFRIVHNASTDALRQRTRRPRLVAHESADERGAEEPVSTAPGPEDLAVVREDQIRLRRALDSLPAPWRSVLLLRDVQDRSYEEIAEVTGQRLGTVKSRLHRARAALRAAVDADGTLAGTIPPGERPQGGGGDKP